MSDKKYKVNPLTGELQEYIFEYNGILALRNFQTKLDGERLILHHADDVNFSLLETLVSEVEINGVVYDNPTAAQEALTRLTFNQNRPTILPQDERALITNALQRGDYIGTARDLFNLINSKVDKVPGKMLSSNDFTNELRKKLEGLQQVDVSVLLPRGNFSGTAQDLKDLIDNLTRILQSPDTELDELQEIVAYIKQNKHILSTLGINNIAGLEDALANKADKDHNHDEVYAPKNHTHPDYAHRAHQHNWDDILRKPKNLATTQNIEDAINNIQIGGRNLLRNSGQKITNNNYDIAVYELTEKIEEGEEVTITIKGKLGTGKTAFAVYNSGGHLELGVLTKKENNLYQGIFKWINKKNQVITDGRTLNIWTYYSNVDVESTIEWIKLERGNKPTDWTPAPEDIEEQIKSLTTSQVSKEINSNSVVDKSWYGQNFNVLASCQIDLTPMENNHNISFRKCFAGSLVTFQADKQIIFTSDNQFNGGDGSTAVVSTANNKIYIDIRNV